MKNNLDIIYIILTILITIVLIPVNLNLALTIGGILSVIGVFFIQSYIGVKLFKSSMDERASYISGRAYSLAFNITFLAVVIIIILIHDFHIPMISEFFKIILLIGWLTFSISVAYIRRFH
ncbi:hypothetical protein [Anaerophilus nitritogenes]|uniref:hypothetical protein n=1 Tax=Anaerophilus nitritogenes TaxID=2498136 RepID=UPI00101E14AD|nr:hypothetical protein [Anaerophilus nitritogenes]